MKKKGWIWLMMVFLVITISVPVMAEEVLVPITKLGLAPWLGEIKDEKDLIRKFAREKTNFAVYIQYDLKEAAKLEVTSSEANEIVNAMESAMRGVKDISVPDETVFKSMGWKSKKGNVMRTKNPILKLGRPIEGFPVKVEFKDYEIEYVFLKDCGNLCLRNVKSELPPKAEYVPPPKEEPKEEAPPPKKEPPKVEAPPPSPVSPVSQPQPFLSFLLGGGIGMGTSDKEISLRVGAGLGSSGGLAPALCGGNYPFAVGMGIGAEYPIFSNLFMGLGIGGYYSFSHNFQKGSSGLGAGLTLVWGPFSPSSFSSKKWRGGIGFAYHPKRLTVKTR